MTTHVKSGGVWREAKNIFAKSGGIWRDCTNVYVKSGGVWRETFTKAITLTSVSATDINVVYHDYAPASDVSGITTATTIPADDGSVSYVWTRETGDVMNSNSSGLSNNQRRYTDFLSDGEVASGTYKVTASNSNGSVSYIFNVSLEYVDDGS